MKDLEDVVKKSRELSDGKRADLEDRPAAEAVDSTEAAEDVDGAEAAEAVGNAEAAEAVDGAEAAEAVGNAEAAEAVDNAEAAEDVDGAEAAEAVDFADDADDAEAVCRNWIVAPEYSGQRLDLFLSDVCEAGTRSYLQKLIKSGAVTVDGKTAKPGLRLEAGGRVLAVFPPVQELTAVPENIPLDILYEDEDLLVVNKPKGMVVHPAAGHPDGTLVNALLYHCKGSLSGINGVLRPGIVHRIDRDTTGSLIICKNDRAHQAIAAQLKVHSITRKYRAIVHGRLTGDGTVNAPIGRHPLRRREMAVNVPGGKPAVTHYHVLETFDQFSSIECRLETGRTHQIRVHMKSIGHPILGDEVYGPAKCPFSGLQGQTLHAMTIGFVHPSTGAYMEFEAPLPEYFQELLQKLRGQAVNSAGALRISRR